jgi:hypothetical protein
MGGWNGEGDDVRWLLIAVLLIAGLTAGCGDDSDSNDGGAPTAERPVGQVSATVPQGGDETPSDGNAPGIPELRGEIIETASGLRYIDERVGDGPSPPTPTRCVTVHYTGWLANGTQFDSSVSRGVPAVFSLSQVIRGWTEGVGSMKQGGKRRLIIPGELGYGPAGRPPAIPPNATLIFDVELLQVGDEPTIQAGQARCPQPSQ